MPLDEATELRLALHSAARAFDVAAEYLRTGRATDALRVITAGAIEVRDQRQFRGGTALVTLPDAW